MEDVQELLNQKDTVAISCKMNLGGDYFLEKMWEYLGLVRVYTKKVK
jgi:ribosome-interacting GTPase 1